MTSNDDLLGFYFAHILKFSIGPIQPIPNLLDSHSLSHDYKLELSVGEINELFHLMDNDPCDHSNNLEWIWPIKVSSKVYIFLWRVI